MTSDGMGDFKSQIEGGGLPSLAGLRCFDAAAQLESFSRAADALHLTHGAVSRAVRNLEDDLGVALFERRSRRVFLTPSGRRLASAVREGFGVMEATILALREQDRAGPLVVSCEPTLLMRWLIPRLPDLHARHPDIDVHLVAGGGAVRLGQGIDLAIRRNDFTVTPGLHAYPLFEERVGPVCRVDRVGDFFDLDQTPLQMHATAALLHSRTRPAAWEGWMALTEASGSEHPQRTFDHFYFSLQAAAAGIGVAIGPWQQVRDDLSGGVLCAPCGFMADGSLYHLLAPTAFEADGPRQRFLDWLRHAAE